MPYSDYERQRENSRLRYADKHLEINRKIRAKRKLKPVETSLKQKLYREKHREKYSKASVAYKRALRIANPQRLLWQRAKARANQLGREFSITLADIIIPKKCPWLGITLKFSEGQPGHSSPSLDRKDSRRGYVIGNIEVISHRANSLKRDGTLDELVQIGRVAARRKRA